MIFIIIGEVETTSNYDITEYEFGNLIVDPRPITVTTPDASWLYDGMVHSLDNLDDIIIGGDGIAPADLVSLNDYTSVRNATAGTPNEASIHIQQYEESGENLVDARDNYAIEYIPGTIVVEPRAILLVTEGYEDVYDGETYYLSAEIFGDGVAPGDGYEIINTPTVRDVTDRINDAGVRFYPMDGSTVSDEEMAPNYVITCQYGTIRVTPRPVIVGADHGEYEYDGTDHSAAATLWVDNLAVRDVMTYVSGVENCMDAMDEPVMNQATYRFMQNDEDMTHNYDITEDFDMLLITPRPILVTRYGLEEIYNGEWHSNEAFDIIYNGANGDVNVDALAPCDEATIDPDTVVKVRDVADSGTLNDMRILIRRRQTNLDASTNYDITYNDAPALVILPRPITVSTGDATKEYDSVALTCNQYRLTAGFDVDENRYSVLSQEDFRYEVRLVNDLTFIGSPSVTSTRDNDVASFKVFDVSTGDEVEVTDNFVMTPDPGTLTIQKLSAKLTSSIRGTVYLRDHVYADYNGTDNWSVCTYSEPTLGSGYSLDYLPAEVLKNLINLSDSTLRPMTEGTMSFDSWNKSSYGTLFPYYMLMTNQDTFKVGDTLTGESYTVSYTVAPENWLAFYYEKRGTAGLLPTEYADIEAQAFQFAKNNYLGISDAINFEIDLLLDEFIHTNRLADFTESERAAQIAAVQAAVQGFGQYDLDADTLYSGDMVAGFLENGRGVCRHYAMLATLLFRQLGIPARYVTGVRMDGMVANQITFLPEVGHAWVEIYVQGLGWVMLEVTPGGSVEDSDPPLPEKIEIELCPTYTEYTYGSVDLPIYPQQSVTSDNARWQTLLDEGYTYRVTIDGQLDGVGSSKTHVIDFQLYDPQGILVYYYKNGVDVLAHETYAFTFTEGTLRLISDKLVQVYPHYKDKEYNGIPLDLVSTDIHEFSNADGYRLGSFAWNFTMIDIGQVTLYDLNASPDLYATYTILDADGRDVTDSVDIQFVNDRQQVVDDQVVFEVKRIPITLRPYDVFMVYKDGAVVRPNGCELVHGSLLEEYGHEINYGAIVINGECSVNGKETVSEIDPNTVIIRDENGQDVTAYYDITYQTGRLYFDEDAA